MISTQVIETILNKHVTDDDNTFEVVIYDTYVLVINILGNISNSFIHIPSNDVWSFDNDDEHKEMPGYIASMVRFYNDTIKEYTRPLAKKWITEHRISEIVLRNIGGSDGIINIYDNYVIVNRRFIVTDHKIYVFKNRGYYECSLTLYNTSILCDIYTANIIGPRYEMPLDKFHTVISHTDDIYKKIVEHRSRGFIKPSTQLCDITISLFFDKIESR